MATPICPRCESHVEVGHEKREETYHVKGEAIKVEAEVTICKRCGHTIFDEVEDARILERAYAIYRRKHGLLSPDDIRTIRQKYGLSQTAMSTLLGCGRVTLHRYEHGGIQDLAHNNLLRFVERPENMRLLLEHEPCDITPYDRKKLKEKVEQLLIEQSSSRLREWLEQFLSHGHVDLMSGNRGFDLHKLRNLKLYIADALGGVLKTKLNKLLFYADFLSFKETSVSITGSRYIHYPFGPVPEHYELILADMIDRGDLELEEEIFDSGLVGERLSSKRETDLAAFTETERLVMKYVADTFRHFTSTMMKARSHQEAGYRETEDDEIISYAYSETLSLSLPEK